jgi:hypothetical protein
LRSRIVLPLAVFCGLTLVVTYPVGLHLASVIIGRPFEDAFESIWFLYWYKHALFDLHVSPLFQPDIFYPMGWDLRLAVMPPVKRQLERDIVLPHWTIIPYRGSLPQQRSYRSATACSGRGKGFSSRLSSCSP